MNCKEAKENMIDLLAEGQIDSGVKGHVNGCSSCAQELESMRKTMSLLDTWKAPEPSPYFLTRMRAHMREEREKQPATSRITGWLRRPAMAVSLATALAAGGAFYTVINHTGKPGPDTQAVIAGTAVSDVEALEKNHDVLVNTDLLDEISGGPSDDVVEN